LNYFLLDLARPRNLLWFWNFGFMLGISMVIQVLSGFLLSLYYNDSVNYAFYSVRYLILEVENGYEFRFIHSSGARLLFFLILQIFTGIFLAMKYVAFSSLAFGLVLDVCFENHYAWWLKSLHANGASFFFYNSLFTYS